METVWLTATIWTGLALAASVVSLWLGLSIALTEIFAGSVGGNALGLQTTPWLDFLVGFGSVLLTFLAGAEIDPESFRRHLKPSPAIGAVAFLFPFLGALVAGWDLSVVEIAGIALSTTSVGGVYAVMVETGLNESELGKLILAAGIVIGHRGHAGSRHRLAGSTAERLVDHAPCDVPVERPRGEPLRGEVGIP